MKIILGLFFIFNINAGELPLESGLSLSWPSSHKVKISPFLQLSAYKGDGSHPKGKYSFVIRNFPGKNLIHKTIVKRQWRRELAQLKKMGEDSVDLGCQKKEKAYICSRTSHSEGRNIFEQLIWTPQTKSSVRVSSLKLKKELQNILVLKQ